VNLTPGLGVDYSLEWNGRESRLEGVWHLVEHDQMLEAVNCACDHPKLGFWRAASSWSGSWPIIGVELLDQVTPHRSF
jgi:hypothetical protein